MSPTRILSTVFLACGFTCVVAWSQEETGPKLDQWPQWRGPLATGEAPRGRPPASLDLENNLKWKTPLPGLGHGSPVVWGQHVFVVTAVATSEEVANPRTPHREQKTVTPDVYYEYRVLCLDRDSGEVLWDEVAVAEAPHEGSHRTNSFASASPVTDGESVYVSFGSRGVFRFDLEGDVLWERNLGEIRTRYGWGEGSSPTLGKGVLVVNFDQEDESFIEALDAENGETLWRLDRDEPTTWATPLIVEHEGTTQAVIHGTNRVRSYALESGELLWECGGQTLNAIPSPLSSNGVVYCLSGFRGNAAYAISLASRGDVTDDEKAILWRHFEGTPYVPSALLYRDRLYFTAGNRAVLTVLEASSGDVLVDRSRLPEVANLYASPVAADGRLYFAGRDGTIVVLKATDSLDLVSVEKLEEPIDASPAIVGSKILVRTHSALYCFEDREG